MLIVLGNHHALCNEIGAIQLRLLRFGEMLVDPGTVRFVQIAELWHMLEVTYNLVLGAVPSVRAEIGTDLLVHVLREQISSLCVFRWDQPSLGLSGLHPLVLHRLGLGSRDLLLLLLLLERRGWGRARTRFVRRGRFLELLMKLLDELRTESTSWAGCRRCETWHVRRREGLVAHLCH